MIGEAIEGLRSFEMSWSRGSVVSSITGIVRQLAYLPQQWYDYFSDIRDKGSDADDGRYELPGTTDGAYIRYISHTDHLSIGMKLNKRSNRNVGIS